jgi:hypothetical protein
MHAGAPQQGAVAQGEGVIAGRVVDALTGEPIAAAQVAVRGFAPITASQPGSWTPLVPLTRRASGPDGRFEFTDLPVGQYLLEASAEGYLFGGVGRYTPGDFGVSFDLDARERLADFLVKLWLASTISGVIRDENGDPVVQAAVRPLEADYQGGIRFWTAGRNSLVMPSLTDDRGMYRLTGLMPGEYILAVSGAGRGPLARPREGPVLETTYSGGARTAADAAVITLAPGEQRSGVDVQVLFGNPAARFPVSGRVVGPSSIAASLTVRLVGAQSANQMAASFEELTAATSADGTFSFGAVPAGEYRLLAWRFPEAPKGSASVTAEGIASSVGIARGQPLPPVSSDPTWFFDQPLEVTRPMTDLQVALQPAARIQGRVIFEGAGRRPAAEELPRIPVHVMPALGRTLGTVPGSRIEADGTFVTPGLPPGLYGFWIRPDFGGRVEMSSWRVKSVTVDGRPLVGRPIEVDTSDLNVTVTFTEHRPGRLTGRVLDPAGMPRPDARIIVFERDPEKRGYGVVGMHVCAFRSAPGLQGQYTVLTRPSCDLIAAAVTAPPRLWMAPDYLESLVPFAVPVDVAPGGTRTMDLIARP